MKFSAIFKHLIVILFVVLAAIGFFVRDEHIKNAEKEREIAAFYAQKEVEWQNLSLKLRSEINRFRGISGIFIRDLKFGFEFTHNENELFPSASLAKIPIMAAAFKAEHEGILDLGLEVRLNNSDKMPGAGTLKSMSAGTVFTFKELLRLMVSISDNTATNMVTRVLGIEYINDAINEFGLQNSRLNRRVADYEARDRGIENYTTPRDMAIILDDMYRGKLVSEEASQDCLELLLDPRSRDRIPKYLPENIRAVHKTGLERGVCHDAGIVFDPGGDFLICVLTGHSNPNSVPSKNFIARIALLVYERYNFDHDLTSDDIVKIQGSEGEMPVRELDTRAIQIFLRDIGLYKGAIDGIIGPRTRDAVKEFQRDSGLTPDGIVGKKTSSAIIEHMSKSPKSIVHSP
jgi:beta-lactamase class A